MVQSFVLFFFYCNARTKANSYFILSFIFISLASILFEKALLFLQFILVVYLFQILVLFFCFETFGFLKKFRNLGYPLTEVICCADFDKM